MNYTDEQKQTIYNAFCKYQESQNIPAPMYQYQAYTNYIYELWERALQNS